MKTIIRLTLLCGLFFSIAACKSSIQRIAHAGGGLNGDSYTNSLAALNHNYEKGFDLFEIDFEWTADDQLVCIHDWHGNFKKRFGFDIAEKPSSAYLESIRGSIKYPVITLPELAKWIEMYPRAKLVTDVKIDNLKALELISKTINDYSVRVIPQIYDPNEYEAVKRLGYNKIILTLYKYPGSNEKIIEAIKSMDLYAVTMPPLRAKQNLAKELHKINVPTYVHTINSMEDYLEFANKYGITEVYTDFLPPR